jgi:hypothetical protein
VVGEIDVAEKKGGDKEGMLPKILSKFESSRAYNLDKASFGFIESAFSQLEATAMVVLGFMYVPKPIYFSTPRACLGIQGAGVQSRLVIPFPVHIKRLHSDTRFVRAIATLSSPTLSFTARPFLWDQSVELASRVGLGESEIVVALVFMGLNMAYENVVHLYVPPLSMDMTWKDISLCRCHVTQDHQPSGQGSRRLQARSEEGCRVAMSG